VRPIKISFLYVEKMKKGTINQMITIKRLLWLGFDKDHRIYFISPNRMKKESFFGIL